MSETGQTSGQAGVDLARVALRAAKKAAKARGTAPAKPTARVRKTAGRRTDGRDPVPLGAALSTMMSDRARQAPAAGGSLADRWADIAPELAGKVLPVRFRAETGMPELRPTSPAYATQLRLPGQQPVTRINAKLSDGRHPVRPRCRRCGRSGSCRRPRSRCQKPWPQRRARSRARCAPGRRHRPATTRQPRASTPTR